MKITYYKLYCKDEEIKEVYIGSTQQFKRRINRHKSNCNLYNEQPVYLFINVNGGFDNWDVEILDEIEVEGKKRYEIEREFIEKYPLNLNYIKPTRTNAEKCKKYYYTHYEKIREKIKKWKEERFTCECGSNITKAEKPRHFRTQKHINYIELNK